MTTADICTPIVKDYFYFIAAVRTVTAFQANQTCLKLGGQLPSENDQNLTQQLISVRALQFILRVHLIIICFLSNLKIKNYIF